MKSIDDKPKRKNGRPLFFVDWKLVEGFCMSQCNQEEIASFVGCSLDTLDKACKRDNKKSFSEFFGEKKKRGFLSLRHKQYQLAIGGNITMLIWLGKQYLGQTDKQKIETKDLTEPKEPVLDLEDLKEKIKLLKAVSEIPVTTIIKP